MTVLSGVHARARAADAVSENIFAATAVHDLSAQRGIRIPIITLPVIRAIVCYCNLSNP
jgi:hypothetical protein